MHDKRMKKAREYGLLIFAGMWHTAGMTEVMEYIRIIPDGRQSWKVEHALGDIVVITLFATLANADDWVEMEIFAKGNEQLLKKYIPLKNGIPSHDTIGRVMAAIDPAYTQTLMRVWREFLDRGEGEAIKRILNIDGKTMRGSGNKNAEALHTVSAWSKEDGVSFGQKSAAGRGKEIPLITELLEMLSVKDTVVTIDAAGTQTAIAEKIVKKKGDYVLAVKGNQPTLHDDLKLYFADGKLRDACGYRKTVDKARGKIETREYWQTGGIGWLKADVKWAGLRSIGMARNTVDDGVNVAVEERYFISSLPAVTAADTELFARSVRGHWAIESMHWHLDVTFREDRNQTREKTAAENLGVMRKWSLSILKLLTLDKKYSLKKKRFALGCNFGRYVDKIMTL